MAKGLPVLEHRKEIPGGLLVGQPMSRDGQRFVVRFVVSVAEPARQQDEMLQCGLGTAAAPGQPSASPDIMRRMWCDPCSRLICHLLAALIALG